MKPNSTQGIALANFVDVAASATDAYNGYDLYSAGQGRFSGLVNICIGRRTGAAFTATWPRIFIEASRTDQDEEYFPLIGPIVPAVGATIANTTLNGAVSAAATSIVVAANTNIASGDTLFIGDASSANYELARVKQVSGTTIYLWDALKYAHTTGAVVTDQAEQYAIPVDLSMLRRIRAVCDNQGSGQNIAFKATLMTFDGIS